MSSSFVDESGSTRFHGRLTGAGALPPQWAIDPDGTLNIKDGNGVTRASLMASGQLKLYRDDGTIGARITPVGAVHVFDEAETIVGSLTDLGLRVDAESGSAILDVHNGFIHVDGAAPRVISVNGLPLADPLVVNQLWNDGGTVKISAGPPP